MARQARILDFEEARSSSSRRTSKSRTSGKAQAATRSTSKRSSSTRSTAKSATARSSKSGSSRAGKSASFPLKAASSRASKETSARSGRGSSKAAASSRSAASASAKRTTSAKRSNSKTSAAQSSAKRTSASSGKTSKFEKIKRDLKKKYASFKFSRSGADTPDAAASDAPRAALYKAEMGASHKKATRMQDGKPTGFSLGRVTVGPRASIALVVCACLVVSCVLLYAPIKNYYTAVRDQAKAEVAYDIVTTRNDALVADMSLLSTDAGVEDRARENYGWVKPGENSVTVVGLDDGSASPAEVLRTVTLNDVKAPETWYSPFFDSVFGYEG